VYNPDKEYVLQDGTVIPPPQSLKALARRVAKDRESGMSGDEQRARYGGWLTGHVRRDLFRLIDREDLIRPSYDRDDAARKRRRA
jgi:hypothetical protein